MRRDRGWRLAPDGGGRRDADEERRGSLAFPVPWMRAARQSSAAARRARYLLSVLRDCGPVVPPPGDRGGAAVLTAYKRMNWFATPPYEPKRYRNPRGFRKKEVKLHAALVALGKATCLKE